MRLLVNGLEQEVVRDDHALDDLLVPLLRRWIKDTEDGQRHWALLAAPPGAGKSTLCHLLAKSLGVDQLQCLGLDGFHLPQRVLDTTMYDAPDGSRRPLASIKGAPETFDAEGLVARMHQSLDGDVAWPAYDRRLHDVVEGAETVHAEHVLLEGNWLLLDDPRWTPVRHLADITIFLQAPEPLLRQRLIERKIQGGWSADHARAFYEASDGPNVRRALTHSHLDDVDLLLHMAADGSLHESELP